MALLDEGQLVARYEVLGRIATGGMSEVYLARQSGPGGFSKTVVLKIILPNLADDPNFVRMFGNEAKLAALLNHPNVVQIFDFGVDGAIHYMAMEYIDGRNLNHIMRALEESSQRMPIDVALRVIADACGALEYAHSLTDTDGSPLDVIHRDVSLENVLVTYGGQVKLVDFGVAKARNLESYTQVGTLKGKYAYMAPEMVEGKVLDNRADLFSMGVVMYQLFTGEPPFAGVNHAMILHQIAYEAPRAPRQVAPDLDPELERIVLRALEKRPEVRYGRAAEIQADIEHYMRRTGAALMPHQLAQFMQELFPPGTDPTRETYQKLCGTGAGLPRGEVRTGPATPAGSALGGPPRWLDDDSLATREVASIPQEDRPSSMPDVPDDFDGPTRISFGTDEGGPAHDTDPSNQWQAPSVGIDPAHADSEDASGAVATASYGARASRRQGPYNEGYEQSVNRRRRPPSSSILDQPDSRPTIVPGELRAVQRSNPSALAAPTTLEGGFEAPSSAPQIPSVAPPADTNPPSYPSNIPRTVPPSAEMMAVNVPAARPAEVPVTTIGSLPETNVAEPRRRGHRRALFFGALGLGVLLIASMVVYIVATGDGDGDEVDPGSGSGARVASGVGSAAARGSGTGSGAVAAARGSGTGSAVASTAGGSGSGSASAAGASTGSGSGTGVGTGSVAAGSASGPPLDAAPTAVVVKSAADAAARSPDAAPAAAPADAAAPAVVASNRPGSGSGSADRPKKRVPRRVPRTPRNSAGQLSVLALGNATLYIDGKRHGPLPMNRIKLEPGEHRVEIRGLTPKYRVVRSVTIKRGGRHRLRVVPKKGTLVVRVRPWALVTLDGRRMGTTPIPAIKLFEGPHVIVLENNKIGARMGRRIVIRGGQEKVLKVRLQPRKKRDTR